MRAGTHGQHHRMRVRPPAGAQIQRLPAIHPQDGAKIHIQPQRKGAPSLGAETCKRESPRVLRRGHPGPRPGPAHDRPGIAAARPQPCARHGHRAGGGLRAASSGHRTQRSMALAQRPEDRPGRQFFKLAAGWRRCFLSYWPFITIPDRRRPGCLDDSAAARRRITPPAPPAGNGPNKQVADGVIFADMSAVRAGGHRFGPVDNPGFRGILARIKPQSRIARAGIKPYQVRQKIRSAGQPHTSPSRPNANAAGERRRRPAARDSGFPRTARLRVELNRQPSADAPP